MPKYPFEARYRPGMKFALLLGGVGAAAVALAIATGRFDDETDPTAPSSKTPVAADASGASSGVEGEAAVHETLAVAPGASVALLDAPGGERIGTVDDTTTFGSGTVLSVSERRGPWIGVETELSGSDPIAWVREQPSRLEPGTTPWSLRADLGAGELELRRDGETVETIDLSPGESASGMAPGRYAVSDHLGAGVSPSLGDGALALTAVTGELPPDWPIGDRVAIHGGDEEDADSSLRVSDAAIRTLLDRVPIGAPVYVEG